MSKPKIKSSQAEDPKILNEKAPDLEKEPEISSQELEDEIKKIDNSEEELPVLLSNKKAPEKKKKEPNGTFRFNKLNKK